MLKLLSLNRLGQLVLAYLSFEGPILILEAELGLVVGVTLDDHSNLWSYSMPEVLNAVCRWISSINPT